MAYATNSSGNYSGTIIVSPIRPANPSSTIATVFSNEIKGSHHTYETITERDAVIESRRDWGMLCTIYNDPTPSNNKTYILRYGFVNTNILDNDNWIEFVTTGANFVPTGGEWLNSVQIVSATPSILTDGYRYLVDVGGIGDFLGQDGKIAQYNLVALTFSFVEPTDGTTLRNDSEPNVVYKYQGSFSSGSWVKEYLNQVRYLTAYSIDGMSYSATSSQTPLTSYSDSVYYVNFNMTSSGTVSLNIDSIGLVDIKKLENNTLSFISTNEIIPNVQYQLLYNSGIFQTVLPTSTTTTIGPAEDGDYTDGLFTDFTTSTPIGTPVDRFNEFLKNIAPPLAPTFSSWSATGSFVDGGLSFDSTVGGFVSATGSPYGSVGKGETFSSSANYYRLGIMSKVNQPITGDLYHQDISGTFNINVPMTFAYVKNSFGYGDTGTLSLHLNGITISSVDLSVLSAIDTTSGGATSGVDLSASTASTFTNGVQFPQYQNRTGSYLIKRDNPNIVDGYNYFIARHDTNSNSYVLSQFEFVADGSTQSVSTSVNSITNVLNTSKKYISGIEYYTTPFRVNYEATIQNLLSNTFNQSDVAITFKDLTSASTGATNSVTNTPTLSGTNNLFNFIGGSQSLKISPPPGFVPSSNISIGTTFSINSNCRRLNDKIAFSFDAMKTVQGTFSSATSSGGTYPYDGWFIDTYTNTGSLNLETFQNEFYRKNNGASKYDVFSSTLVGAQTSTYSSSLPLRTNNGLQVINGGLYYPKFNFNTAGTVVSNPNFGFGSNRDYSVCFTSTVNGHNTTNTGASTQNRTFTRYFETLSVSSNFLIKITSPVANLININSNNIQVSFPISADRIWLEVKFFPANGAVTGWLDMSRNYTGTLTNGFGCLSSNRSILGDDIYFYVTCGSLLTNKMLFRITAGPDWSHYITRIEVVKV